MNSLSSTSDMIQVYSQPIFDIKLFKGIILVLSWDTLESFY